MDQHITFLTVLNQRFARVRVARDDNRSIRRVEAIAERLRQFTVRIPEGRHRDVRILVDDARLDFRAARRPVRSATASPSRSCRDIDVDMPRLHDVARHIGQTRRPVDLERGAPPLDPRREDQIRVANGVIGVQVGDEGGLQAIGGQRRNSALRRGGGTADDASSEIDEVSAIVDDDRSRGPRPQWVSRRRTGPQQNDLRTRRLLAV